MKLASLTNGTRDGRLVVVSRDLTRATSANAVAATMQQALENWNTCEASLSAIYDGLNAGRIDDSFEFDPDSAMAPLPRSYQFVDGSAFLNHGELMIKAYKLPDKADPVTPILIQRQGDDFRGPRADYEFPTEADGGDFEGEFAVVLDDVPAGTAREQALQHVKLITIFNDMSMRGHLLREKQMGFGFIQAKPATIFAPVAITPDELGEHWRDGRVHLDMRVSRNGEWFGNPNGREMNFGFDELISHLAYNRNLGAGTIIGSGTVSNREFGKVGCACLAERRAIETITEGEPKTPFLKFGETLRFEVVNADDNSLFGAIAHRLVQRS